MTSLSDLGFNQMTNSSDRIGDDVNPSYNQNDIYNEIEDDRNQADLDQMMDILHTQEQNQGGNNSNSYADNILDKSDKFKIFSSIFMDLKDPLIMFVITWMFFSKWGRKSYRDKVPFVHDPETGSITYSGMGLRFVLILVIFYIVRRLLNSYFTG